MEENYPTNNDILMPAKRPIFIWVAGLILISLGVLSIITILAIPLVKDTVFQQDASPEQDFPAVALTLFLSICMGLIGIGLFFGRRISLVVAKVLWVLWMILLVISTCAAGISGAGLNFGHGAGLLAILLTIPLWSSSVTLFCNKSIRGHIRHPEKSLSQL